MFGDYILDSAEKLTQDPLRQAGMQIQISQEKLNQEIVAHLLDYFSDAQIDGLKIQLSEAQLLADLIVGDILRQRQARLEIERL